MRLKAGGEGVWASAEVGVRLRLGLGLELEVRLPPVRGCRILWWR